MKHLTQKDRIINRINEVGYVDNFWAINNYILRLASVMSSLKKKGIKFKKTYGEGSNRKNYYYYPETLMI